MAVGTVNKRAVDLLMGHMNKAVRARGASDEFIHAPDDRVAKFSLSYLDAFGYLTKELAQWKDVKLEDIVKAIKQFQDLFGIPATGRMCVKTVRAMEMPRCGCPDIERARHKGFKGMRDFAAINLPRWSKAGVTYKISDYLPGITPSDFDAIIYQCFQAWTMYGNLEVRPANGSERPDIVISNGQGPQSNFDGPGGTLAWAYLPDGNDNQLLMKFDLSETWIINPAQRGIIVANVATHEFGHLLGLDHSRMQSALMAPYYNAALAVPQQQDDIPRFTARYGIRPSGPAAPPPSVPGGPRPVVKVTTNNDVDVQVNGRVAA